MGARHQAFCQIAEEGLVLFGPQLFTHEPPDGLFHAHLHELRISLRARERLSEAVAQLLGILLLHRPDDAVTEELEEPVCGDLLILLQEHGILDTPQLGDEEGVRHVRRLGIAHSVFHDGFGFGGTG